MTIVDRHQIDRLSNRLVNWNMRSWISHSILYYVSTCSRDRIVVLSQKLVQLQVPSLMIDCSMSMCSQTERYHSTEYSCTCGELLIGHIDRLSLLIDWSIAICISKCAYVTWLKSECSHPTTIYYVHLQAQILATCKLNEEGTMRTLCAFFHQPNLRHKATD